MRRWQLWILVVAVGLSLSAAGTYVCRPGETRAAASEVPTDALALEDAIVAVVEDTLASVVTIEIKVPIEAAMGPMSPFGMPFDNPFFHLNPDMFGDPGERDEEEIERLTTGWGSGVVHSADGHIVTNNHVVEDAAEIRVIFRDGRSFPAEIVGADAESDLAVIKIDAEGLTPVRYADIDSVKPGQFAVAVGMPLGLDYSVTVGHVSALGRGGFRLPELMLRPDAMEQPRLTIQNFIQTDAAINPGNSGGPLVNLRGEVMGINTIVAGGVGGGFGFAISSDLVQKVATDLVESGNVSRAWLGISMSDLTYEKAQALEVGRTHGALIEDVFEGSPAANAGLERGDVIIAVGGEEVRDSADVIYRVSSHAAGERVQIGFVRKGKDKRVNVQTGERREGLAASNRSGLEGEGDEPEMTQVLDARYGMQLQAITSEINASLDRSLAAGGVLVVSSIRSSAAARAGLSRGDVIIDVDGKTVDSPDDVMRFLDKTSKEYVPLTVERDGQLRFVALKKLVEVE